MNALDTTVLNSDEWDDECCKAATTVHEHLLAATAIYMEAFSGSPTSVADPMYLKIVDLYVSELNRERGI